VFSDQYNHASLIDGMRLSRAEVFVYRHADARHLERLLREHAGKFRRRLIATDGVFSMHGDLAPLPELVLHLVNRARSLVFSTAMPPASAAAARAALELVEKEPFRREHLLHLARELRQQLQDQGWNVPPGVTPIVPVFVGTEQRVLELAGQLRRRGG